MIKAIGLSSIITAEVRTYTHYIPIVTRYLTTALLLQVNCILNGNL